MTPAPASVSRLPLLLPRPSGDLFALHFFSGSAQRAAGGVVILQPFAEEMNRSRRMAALQACALADTGVETLLVDLHGCGDSAGDFGDASWPLWIDGAHSALEWMADRVKDRVSIVGLRLGAVLAADVAVRYPRLVSRLVLWQPVISGKTALTQFLRIRLAASLTGSAGRETTESLRGALAAGEHIEIAGYDLSPALAQALESLSLEALAPPPAIPVDWFEIVSDSEQPVPPISMKLVETWRNRGSRVEFRTVVGEAFWSTQETAVAPQLLNATARLFDQVPA